jgi:hypothetical protein
MLAFMRPSPSAIKAAFLALAALSLTWSREAKAQTPTVEETLRWLGNNTLNITGKMGQSRVTTTLLWESGCTIYYRYIDSNSDYSLSQIKTGIVPLGSQYINTKIEYDSGNEAYRVTVRNPGGDGRSVLITSEVAGQVVHRDYFLAFDLYFNDREKAERVSRALGHAIRLCGGQPEPF